MTGKRQETVAALQAALAAEHAAIYGYGVLGAHLSGPQRETATQIWTGHRARRDRLRSSIVAAGGRPKPAAPAYRLPFPVSTARSAAQLAAALEDGVVGAYIGLAGVRDGTLRRYAALAMQEATVRALRWRGGAAPAGGAFPALPASALSPMPE